MSVRRPAVAGSFYEGTAQRLRRQVDGCIGANPPSGASRSFVAAVSPHAGLMYSGHVAAALFQIVEVPRRVVILGPNHTGWGKGVAVDPHQAWSMPFGEVPIDAELRDEVLRQCALCKLDSAAHAREHSLEVQLPFLQDRRPDLMILPICLGDRSYETCAAVGESLAQVVRRWRDRGEDVAIIASSDLSHYLDQQTTLEKDQKAIDRILALDPRGLYQTVEREAISMCGYLPVTAALVAARELGATRAELVKHATSGDVSGDYESVVGYASVLIW